MADTSSTFGASAYGGDGWSPRERTTFEELGDLWNQCGQDSEWQTLRAVLLHRPGGELLASADPDAVQMLAPIDVMQAAEEHDALADAYRAAGVKVHYVAPADSVRPNQMFCADLMFATREGIILARPASTVRAGEEREVARRLADIGVPIVRSISTRATFEGADAAWLDPRTVAIGRGLRTNDDAIGQIAEVLSEDEIGVLAFDMPFGTMHLMGMLRIVDQDLAVCWPRRTPHALVMTLREMGYSVLFLPETSDHEMNRAMNFVTLGPRRVLMEAGYGAIQDFFESNGIECTTIPARELIKAAGGFGCLTGVLHRDPAGE